MSGVVSSLGARVPPFARLLLAFGVVLVLLLSGVQGVLGREAKQIVELCLGMLLLSAFAVHPVVARTRKGVSPLAARLALAAFFPGAAMCHPGRPIEGI
jgi:hypothetical protein